MVNVVLCQVTCSSGFSGSGSAKVIGALKAEPKTPEVCAGREGGAFLQVHCPGTTKFLI